MNRSSIAVFCMNLLLVSISYPMEKRKFENGSIVRVVGGPKDMRNTIMKIQGTTEEVWDIDDVDGSAKSFTIGALIKYLGTDHPDYGQVYYAEYVMFPKKDCVHESWLEI